MRIRVGSLLVDDGVDLRHYWILLKVCIVRSLWIKTNRLSLPVEIPRLYLRKMLGLLSLVNGLGHHYLLGWLIKHVDWGLLNVLRHLHLERHFLSFPLGPLHSV